MRMSIWAAVIGGAFVLPVSTTVTALANMTDVTEAAYGRYSVSAPTPDRVFICHGFGCKYRAELDLTAKDRAKLAQLLAVGSASAAAERRAVAAAGAWFDRRVGTVAGTQHHVGRAGAKYMFDVGQFDCIDSSRNMTSLLLVLEQLKLLRHHDVDVPEARGFLVDGRPPHATAVLLDKASGAKWAVDSWTRGYGQVPEIMPLSRWMTLD